MSDLEGRLDAIEARNRKVEADKKWEGSVFRRILIMGVTYILVGIYLSYLGVADPWEGAVVPMLGFLLSTLTLGAAKEYWIGRYLHGK